MNFFKLFLLTLIFVNLQVFAKEIDKIILNKERQYFIGNKIKVFIDRTKKLKINDVAKKTFQGNFKSLSVKNNIAPNFGINKRKDIFWVKFSVLSKKKVDWFFYSKYFPNLRKLTFYEMLGDGEWKESISGSLIPFSKNKNIKFSFPLKSTKESTYFLKMEGINIRMPFYIATKDNILEKEKNENIEFGIFAGLILALIINNILLGLNTKTFSFLFFSVFAFFNLFVVSTLNGYFAQYITPNYSWPTTRGLLLGFTMALFAGNYFTITYLNLKKHKYIYNFMIMSQLINVVYLILWLFPQLEPLLLQLIGYKRIFWIFNLFFAIYVYKKGHIPGIFYFVGFLFIVAAGFFVTLTIEGIIPFYKGFENIPIWGITINLLCLSFGLSYNFNLLKERAIEIEENFKNLLLKSLQMEKDNSRALEISRLEQEEDHKQLAMLYKKLEETNQSLELKVKKRTNALDISLSKLRSVMEDKLTFYAKMSHELRTPLNAILGFSQILLHEDNQTKDKKKEYLDCILSSGESLLGLIDEVHELSKIDLDKIKIKKAPFFLTSLLNNISTFYSNESQKKGLNFFYEIDKDIPQVIISDELRIKQILYNLLGNALKFTSSGSVNLKVNFNKGDAPEGFINLHFIIVDTGSGIKEEDFKKVFEKFEQTSDDLNVGSGMGLFITKSIIEKMNGVISLKSTIDKGTQFNVILRSVKIYEGPLLKENFEDQKISYQFKKQKLLIVDDLENNLKLLEAYLNPYEFIIEKAYNGIQLINKSLDLKPDLIITDIKMPSMDGDKAKKEMEKIDILKDTPIIAISALPTPKKNQELFNSFLTKPLKKEILIKELAKYLDHEKIYYSDDPIQEKGEKVVNQKLFNLKTELLKGKDKKILENFVEEINFVLKNMDIGSLETFISGTKKYKVHDFFEGLEDWITNLNELIQSAQRASIEKELEKALEKITSIIEKI